jgi:hypothetical protein
MKQHAVVSELSMDMDEDGAVARSGRGGLISTKPPSEINDTPHVSTLRSLESLENTTRPLPHLVNHYFPCRSVCFVMGTREATGEWYSTGECAGTDAARTRVKVESGEQCQRAKGDNM